MNRYLIGGVIIIGFIILAVASFDKQKIEYADLNKAQETGQTVQVMGTWDKTIEYEYNSESNKFIFHMLDEKSERTKVIFDGAKPNNFELADKLVVKGKFVGSEFHATSILTKCPSKYEGKAEDLQTS